jgi:hypothetical protein
MTAAKGAMPSARPLGQQSRWTESSAHDFLVLAAVAADEVSRREYCEEMGIQFIGAAASPAHAEEIHFPFKVRLPIGSYAIVRCEHLKEMVANCLVSCFILGEATGAPRIGHAIAFH